MRPLPEKVNFFDQLAALSPTDRERRLRDRGVQVAADMGTQEMNHKAPSTADRENSSPVQMDHAARDRALEPRRPSSTANAGNPKSPAWFTYSRFDDALANNFFTSDQAGVPVYLDMDDDAFEAAAMSLGLTPADFTRDVIDATRDCLNIDDRGAPVFARFDRQVSLWRIEYRRALKEGQALPHPPVTALLATFTLAAESMGDSKTTHINDTAYYARLLKLLDVPESESSRFKNSFRNSSEGYWDALRMWLEGLDGNHGLASAYALHNRYVGLPISQALIRDTERRQLKNMFSDMALPAGMGISQTDMETSLGQWIAATPSPASASMRQLWANPDSRGRIVEIAIVEFDAWDGYGRDKASGTSKSFVRRAPRCSLAVSERHGLFGMSIEVAFVVPASAATSGQVTVTTATGPVPIMVTGVGNSLVGATATAASLDSESILSGVLTVVADNETTFQRFPRNVVPLVKDAFANVFVETERVVVGDPAAVLVRGEGSLVSQVAQILDEVARPGYTKREASAGLPDGWVLFTDVQFLKTPSPRLIVNPQLDSLVPRLSTQMTLAGGLRLPGRIARWSALDQPQLAVASEDPARLRVTCTARDVENDDQNEMQLASPQEAPFVVNLSEHKLSVGDYVITLYAGDKRLQTQTLRLRSSDELDRYSWNKIEQLAHRDSDPLWPVRAQLGDGSIRVDGAFASGPAINITGHTPATTTTWRRPLKPRSTDQMLRIATPASDSCVVTGAHKIVLPTFSGKPEGRWVFGSCSVCGITKRSPAQHWDKELQKRTSDADVRTSTSISELTAAQPRTQSWAAAVDALIYLGAGSAADLHSLARQIEDSASFEHDFVRSLEALGMIETHRDDEFRILRFEVASACFAELEDSSFLISGAWPRDSVSALYQVAERLGGEALVVEAESATIPLIAGVDAGAIRNDTENDEVEIARQAGRSMLAILPALSEVAASLPRVPIDFTVSAEAFSTESASWQRVRDTDRAGAYRIRNAFNSTYLYRSAADVEHGTAARVPVDLAKHLAAQLAGKPLLAYNPTNQQLRVPTGAHLPGLYERAAVLSSGELPQRDASTFSLVYTEIDETFAQALMTRLI
jgi:hypothetical protein